VKKFKQAERMGLYCRVLVGGEINPGDPVTVEPYAGETVSILEMTRDHYAPDNSEAALRRFLAAPIAIRDREEKEAALRDLIS
jgi:MOSC domain-containing protein YiiM